MNDIIIALNGNRIHHRFDIQVPASVNQQPFQALSGFVVMNVFNIRMDIQSQFKRNDEQIRNWLESAHADDRIEWAQHHKEKGKRYYNTQKYFEAFQEYYMALIALKEMSDIAFDLINNMGIIAEKLSDQETSEMSYKVILKYNKNN